MVLFLLAAASAGPLLAQEQATQAPDENEVYNESEVHKGAALEGIDPAQVTCREFATMKKRQLEGVMYALDLPGTASQGGTAGAGQEAAAQADGDAVAGAAPNAFPVPLNRVQAECQGEPDSLVADVAKRLQDEGAGPPGDP
ncbi:hypothetical protein [Geminicoccus harenae]|uniref:hypothetical protein n=1 Tax=Geminicoccus harenae TaxID=2498453 RepID=UPI00168BB4AA|nr:hypothetical protein [Geminicoccus harenae]